jgi:hypothetical protein
VIIVEANTGLGVMSQNVVVTLTVADASPPINLASPLAFTYQANDDMVSNTLTHIRHVVARFRRPS